MPTTLAQIEEKIGRLQLRTELLAPAAPGEAPEVRQEQITRVYQRHLQGSIATWPVLPTVVFQRAFWRARLAVSFGGILFGWPATEDARRALGGFLGHCRELKREKLEPDTLKWIAAPEYLLFQGIPIPIETRRRLGIGQGEDDLDSKAAPPSAPWIGGETGIDFLDRAPDLDQVDYPAGRTRIWTSPQGRFFVRTRGLFSWRRKKFRLTSGWVPSSAILKEKSVTDTRRRQLFDAGLGLVFLVMIFKDSTNGPLFALFGGWLVYRAAGRGKWIELAAGESLLPPIELNSRGVAFLRKDAETQRAWARDTLVPAYRTEYARARVDEGRAPAIEAWLAKLQAPDHASYLAETGDFTERARPYLRWAWALGLAAWLATIVLQRAS